MKLLKLLAPAVLGLVLSATPLARADDATTNAAYNAASEPTNTQITEAQINQLLDQVSGNDPLSKTLKILVQQTQQYLRQMNGMMAEQDGTAPAQSAKSAASVVSQDQTSAPQAAANPAAPAVHLAGYPALPEVAPATSIPSPTNLQLAAGAEVDRKINARKRFFMELTGAVRTYAQ